MGIPVDYETKLGPGLIRKSAKINTEASIAKSDKLLGAQYRGDSKALDINESPNAIQVQLSP